MHTCVYTCTHAYCLSCIELFVVSLLNKSSWCIHRCLVHPHASSRGPTQRCQNYIWLFIFSIISAAFLTSQFNLPSPPRPRSWVKGNMTQMQPCNCINCILYIHIILHIHSCRHVYRISQVKITHALCLSNTVLEIFCGDSVSFRSGGSVFELRVHNSVRYNYERLIPGKLLWHFIHDVNSGYLIHSSLTVRGPHIRIYALCTHTRRIFDSSTSCLIVLGEPNLW